jgi:alkylation response protein AidB-like acyl-CoA dehydrogenase
MDYQLTDEQKMVLRSVEKLLETDYDFQSRYHRLQENRRFHPPIWQQFADLGLLALPLKTQYGGFSASVQDLAVVMAPMGQALVTEPFLYTSVGAWLFSHVANAELQSEFCPPIAQGRCRVVVAIDPVGALHLMPSHQPLIAKKSRSGQWMLTGSCHMVYGADMATHVIVQAHSGRKTRWFLVPMKSLKRKVFTLIDDTGVARLQLEDVLCDKHMELSIDHSMVTCLAATMIGLLSAEAVGIMHLLNKKTKAYLQQREQFGQPLSQFQLLKHRLVEMYVQEELARSMSMTLTQTLSDMDALDMPSLQMLTHMTKMKLNDYAQYVGEQSVQLHGGMGVSDEMDVAHLFRRLTCIRHQMGDQAYHLARLTEIAKQGPQ